MTATVRLFSHTGLSHAFVASYSDQQAFHAMTMLKQPYLARALITADTGAAQATTTDLSPDKCKLLHIQVQPGKRVHYEVTPKGQTARVADTSSPVMEGDDNIEWSSGWTISLLEAS